MSEAILLVGQFEEGKLSSRAQIIALVVAFLLLLFVIELVRRRRLVERYALLWMLAALATVVLAAWTDGLNWIAERLGIESPPNALFLLGLAAVYALLLNFSVAISRLSEETKILAQTMSRLDADLRAVRRGSGPNGDEPAAGDQDEGDEPAASPAGERPGGDERS